MLPNKPHLASTLINMIYLLPRIFTVDCQWEEWQSGECSVSCGNGIRMKTRRKLVTERDGGSCEGEAGVEEACTQKVCPGKKNCLYILPNFIKC